MALPCVSHPSDRCARALILSQVEIGARRGLKATHAFDLAHWMEVGGADRFALGGTLAVGSREVSAPLSPDLPPQPISEAGEYIFTYDVSWEESDIKWASRWDLYLYMGDDQVHWFSILNSLVIVLPLSGIVAMIMVRTLRRDLAEYNSAEEKEELLEESDWKLVHADVLRTPPLTTLLSTSIGTGMQLLCMSFIAIGERGTAQRRLSDDSNPMPPATATSRRHCAAATTAPNARRHRHRRA